MHHSWVDGQGCNALACCADIIEMQAVDRDFLAFVLRLMQHDAESTQRKLRRTEPSPSNSPVRQAPPYPRLGVYSWTSQTNFLPMLCKD